jgi:hypothetical protein
VHIAQAMGDYHLRPGWHASPVLRWTEADRVGERGRRC